MASGPGAKAVRLPFVKIYPDEVLGGDMRTLDLTPAQVGVLHRLQMLAQRTSRIGYFLVGNRPALLSEIAKAIRFKLGAVTAALDALMERGFVRKQPDGTFTMPDEARKYEEWCRHQANGRKGGNPHVMRLNVHGDPEPRQPAPRCDFVPADVPEQDDLFIAPNGLAGEGVNPERDSSRLARSLATPAAPRTRMADKPGAEDGSPLVDGGVQRVAQQRTPEGYPVAHVAEETRVVASWNAMAVSSKTCKLVKGLPADRRARLRQRLNEVGLDGVLALVEQVSASDHLQGRGKSRRQGFFFDQFVEEGFFVRLQEGAFDNPPPPVVKPEKPAEQRAREHYFASRPRKRAERPLEEFGQKWLGKYNEAHREVA